MPNFVPGDLRQFDAGGAGDHMDRMNQKMLERMERLEQRLRELQEERDAAPAKPAKKSAAKVKGVARVRVADTRKSPARKKRDASTLAKGARRQAKRDSRRG